MNRYENVKKVANRLKTIQFPKIAPSDSDIVIVSRITDRLDLLAQQYYNDQTLYWIIAVANNLGKGSVEIPVGTTIRIPTNYTPIVREYLKLNG